MPEHRRARLLVHYIRNKTPRSDFYLSFVNFSFWGEEVDLFGNLLAALSGLADTSRSLGIVRALKSLGASRPHPVRVVGRPIAPQSPLWRSYMEPPPPEPPLPVPQRRHLALRRRRLGDAAGEAGVGEGGLGGAERLAAVNRVNDWEFNEWFHGLSGEPMGMPGQSWNAALYVLAYRALADGFRLFG